MLSMGRYLGSDGTAYQWQANPGWEIMAQSLGTPDRKRKIEAALTAAAGVESTFLASDSSQMQQKKEEESDEAYLQELYDTFGEEPVVVVDQLPQ